MIPLTFLRRGDLEFVVQLFDVRVDFSLLGCLIPAVAALQKVYTADLGRRLLGVSALRFWKSQFVVGRCTLSNRAKKAAIVSIAWAQISTGVRCRLFRGVKRSDGFRRESTSFCAGCWRLEWQRGVCCSVRWRYIGQTGWRTSSLSFLRAFYC